MFEAHNDQGTAPPKPAIVVESVDNRDNKDSNTDQNDPNLEEENEEEEEEKEEEEEEEEKEENDNETDDQRTARLAQEKEARRQARVQKRIDKLTATVGTKDAEIAELKKQLAEKPKEGLTEEEIERRANAIADARLRDKEADDAKRAFEKTADTLIKNATKVDKDFEKKINEVAQETDTLMPKYMVEILSDLDNGNGHEILAQLANDEDLYEEICALSERKMTRRLDKMSEELKSKGKKPAPKTERRIPDPIEPINDGGNNRGNAIPAKPTQNMDEFVRIRALQTEQFRKARGR